MPVPDDAGGSGEASGGGVRGGGAADGSSFPLFDAPRGNVVHVGPCLLNVHYSTRPAGTQFPIIIPIIRRARRNVGPCLLNVGAEDERGELTPGG